jgi:hypothetical protein
MPDPTSSDERKQIFRWLTVENFIQLVATGVIMAMAFAAVKSDVRDVSTRVEQNTRDIIELKLSQAETRQLLVNLNAKAEVLLERTDPTRHKP